MYVQRISWTLNAWNFSVINRYLARVVPRVGINWSLLKINYNCYGILGLFRTWCL